MSAWATERLPAFLNPRYIQIMAALPMTPSGKVQKAELRKLGHAKAWDRGSGAKR